MCQLALLFGISKSAAGRIIDHLGPLMSLQPRRRFSKGTVLIVDGTLVPTRDHTVAERSKTCHVGLPHDRERLSHSVTQAVESVLRLGRTRGARPV